MKLIVLIIAQLLLIGLVYPIMISSDHIEVVCLGLVMLIINFIKFIEHQRR